MSRSNPYGQRNDGGWSQCADCDRTFRGLSPESRYPECHSGSELGIPLAFGLLDGRKPALCYACS